MLVTTALPDRPGALVAVSATPGETGATPQHDIAVAGFSRAVVAAMAAEPRQPQQVATVGQGVAQLGIPTVNVEGLVASQVVASGGANVVASAPKLPTPSPAVREAYAPPRAGSEVAARSGVGSISDAPVASTHSATPLLQSSRPLTATPIATGTASILLPIAEARSADSTMLEGAEPVQPVGDATAPVTPGALAETSVAAPDPVSKLPVLDTRAVAAPLSARPARSLVSTHDTVRKTAPSKDINRQVADETTESAVPAILLAQTPPASASTDSNLPERNALLQPAGDTTVPATSGELAPTILAALDPVTKLQGLAARAAPAPLSARRANSFDIAHDVAHKMVPNKDSDQSVIVAAVDPGVSASAFAQTAPIDVSAAPPQALITSAASTPTTTALGSSVPALTVTASGTSPGVIVTTPTDRIAISPTASGPVPSPSIVPPSPAASAAAPTQSGFNLSAATSLTDAAPLIRATSGLAATTAPSATVAPKPRDNPGESAIPTSLILSAAVPLSPAATAMDPVAATSPSVIVTTALPHLAHDVGLAIARKMAADGHELHISLDPPEFGRIDVTMAFDDRGNLRAVVSADNAVSLGLLRRDSDDLGRAMSDAGIRADGESFRFEGRGDGRRSGGDEPRQPQQPLIFPADAETETASEAADSGRFRSLRWHRQLDVLA